MSKFICMFFSLMIISMNANAVEPILDQQGMFYINVSFDTGQVNKTRSDFGFRFDRGLIQPNENITIKHLATKPAVVNIKFNQHGLKAFELHGIDYSGEYLAYRTAAGAEVDTGGAKTATAETEVEAQPIPETEEASKKNTIGNVIDNAPVGVLIGIAIAAAALGS